MTTPNTDLSRWLHLTLLGDAKAAASLLIHAKRLNDPLLGLVAQVVCGPVSWPLARQVLDTLPAAALTAEVREHLAARLPKSRRVVTYQDKACNGLLTAAAVRAPAATLHLMTDLSLLTSLDEVGWQALCAAPLPSLRALVISDTAQRLPLSPLDPVTTPWLAGLHSLCLSIYGQLTQSTHDAFNALFARMTQHPAMSLTSLKLTGYRISEDAARALGRAPWVSQLMSLRLCGADLPSVALRAWADAPLTSLRALSIINQTTLQTADIVAFAASPAFIGLETACMGVHNLIEAARLTLTAPPTSDPLRRCLLLLPCTFNDESDALKPNQALAHPRRDAQIVSLGRLLRPHLPMFTPALDASPVPLRMVKGIKRALMCVVAHLNEADAAPLSVSEQAAFAALVPRCARMSALEAATLTLYLPHLTDVATLSRLAADLLTDKRTLSFAFSAFCSFRTLHADLTCAADLAAIQSQAALALLSQPADHRQQAALGPITSHPPLRASLTPWLWAALRDLGAPGPGAAAHPDVAWPPLAAPDGIFRALWTALDPAEPADSAQALTLLQQGAHLRFACDTFYLSAAISREDLLPALLSRLDTPMRQRLLTRLSSRMRPPPSVTSPRQRPQLIDLLAQALTRDATLRAYLPPLASEWPRPMEGRGRAHWATLATINLDAIDSAEGEAARPLLVSLLASDEPLTRELAQQRLYRRDAIARLLQG
jgi:hypothetical protein